MSRGSAPAGPRVPASLRERIGPQGSGDGGGPCSSPSSPSRNRPQSPAGYLFLLVMMPLFGKREIGRWTPMEFLGMLLLARTVGPSLTGGDSSLAVAAVGATTLLGITFLLDYAVHRSRRLEKLIEGKPEILIEDGHVSARVMKREMLTEQQLMVALRREHLQSAGEVERAYIEPDGKITVIPKKKTSGSRTSS